MQSLARYGRGMKNIASFLVALFMASSAFAQTSPNWSYGHVPTTAEWNTAFSNKQDYLNLSNIPFGSIALGSGGNYFRYASPSGTGSIIATVNGSLTSGYCISADANGNLLTAGFACGNTTSASGAATYLPKYSSATGLTASTITNASGTTTFTDTTASSNTTTGAIVDSGGLGVAGTVNVGSNIVTNAAFYSQPSAAPATVILNAPSTSYQAFVNYEVAGAIKWQTGMQTGADPYWFLYNWGAAANGIQIDYTTNAATFANNITGNGTLAMSGAGTQQVSLNNSSTGLAFLLSNYGGSAYAQNYGAGNMNFVTTSTGAFYWQQGVTVLGGWSTAYGLVSNSFVQSQANGFKFPDNTVQASAAFPSNVRQTVMSGPGNSSPSILPSTSASLSITSQNISGTTPLIASVANGFGPQGQSDVIGEATSNITWSSLTASTTNYLYVYVNGGTLTPFSTTLQPIYQYGGTISVTNNQQTFDISQMKMFQGNGSSASQVYNLFVGEAVTGASTVTSTIAYQYNGYYDSGWVSTLPGTATVVSKNSNMGLSPYIANVTFKNLTAEQNFAVGDIVNSSEMLTYTGTSWLQLPVTQNRNTTQFVTGATTAFNVVNKTTGAQAAPTAANWAYRIQTNRGW